MRTGRPSGRPRPGVPDEPGGPAPTRRSWGSPSWAWCCGRGGLGSQSLWYDEWLTQEATGGGPRDLVRHVANREGILPVLRRPLGVDVRSAPARRSALDLAGRRGGRHPRGLRPGPPGGRPVGGPRCGPARGREPWPSGTRRRPGPIPSWLWPAGWSSWRRCGPPGHRTGTPSRTARLVLLAAAAAAAVAVHYFAAFLVAAVGIALLLTRRPAWRSWLLAGVPALVVLALLALLAVKQHSHEANREWITRFPLIDRLDDAGRSALVGPSPPASMLWLAAAAVVAGVGVGLALAPLAERRAAGLLLAVSGGAVALAVVAAGVGVDAVLGRHHRLARPLAVGGDGRPVASRAGGVGGTGGDRRRGGRVAGGRGRRRPRRGPPATRLALGGPGVRRRGRGHAGYPRPRGQHPRQPRRPAAGWPTCPTPAQQISGETVEAEAVDHGRGHADRRALQLPRGPGLQPRVPGRPAARAARRRARRARPTGARPVRPRPLPAPGPGRVRVDDVTANPGDIALVLVDEGLAAGDQRNRPMPGRKRPVVAAQRR